MSRVTKIEYRAVIKFLPKEELTPKIIKERLDGVYGRSSSCYSVVKEWAKRFRMGQEFLESNERPGRPVEVVTEDKVALVEDLVLSVRRLKVSVLECNIELDNYNLNIIGVYSPNPTHNKNGFLQQISVATRVNGDSETTIDHIATFVNNISKSKVKFNSLVLHNSLTDHYPLFYNIEFSELKPETLEDS
nr:unnamed protein product [Callosobruchus analis]